ncbi:hypothetical protein CHUAL_006655 [Chamberlinius hualienensis]
MLFDIDWKEWLDSIVLFAAKNPGTFLYYVLLTLSPLFLLSAVLSWKLAKHLEKEEREKKKKAKREANIQKARQGGNTNQKSSKKKD